MDRYQRVQKPKEATPANENEIRITAQGRMRSYITYATSLLQSIPFPRYQPPLPKHQVKPLSEFDYGGGNDTLAVDYSDGGRDNRGRGYGIGGLGRGRGNGFRGRGRGYGGWTDHQQDNRYNDEAPIFNHGRGRGRGWDQNRGRGRDSRSNGLVRTVNDGA